MDHAPILPEAECPELLFGRLLEVAQLIGMTLHYVVRPYRKETAYLEAAILIFEICINT